MRAFLRVADMIEDGDEEIGVWVKQVRGVAFNTEDVLDEFLFLCSHYKEHGFSSILLKKARSVMNFRARRRIASELESIKSRLTNVSDGHQRYLYKLNIVKQGSTGAAAATHNYSLNDLRRDALLVEEDQLVGIEKPQNKIIKQLLEGKTKLQVVAVAGVGGLGKTTLVSKVFSDPRVKKHFQHQAFVTVSQFKQDEILAEIIQQLFNEMKQPLPQGVDSEDNSKLKRIIVDFLREKRYLVVFDDMWNLDSWESLKIAFPNNNYGSRLMITTRNVELTSTSKVDLGDQNFAAIVNEENINGLPQGVGRLSLHRTMEYLGGGYYNLSKLRSLLFFDVDTSPSSCSMSKFLGDGLRFLKVLGCRGAALDKFPKVILKLYNLRYLSLRETQVSSVPSSIQKLKNLETLELRDTNVVELPVEILKIHGLRHILVYRLCNPFTASCQTIGFKASPGIETLSCLQSLCFIEASQSFTAGLMESLGKLKQLRRLSILKLKESDGYALCSSVQKTRFLYSLSIESENSNEILNLQNISSSPQCLKRLHMSGRLVKLPSWLSSLSCLVRLYLRWSKLEVDPLIHLQALPNLVQLIFEQAYNGKRLRFQTGGFQMLKILMFGKLERLEEVLVEEGSMPRLEELWFRDCKLLKKVPCGVGFLTELKYLEFVDMAPELIRRLGRSKIYEDYDKIKHVPSIFTGNQRDWGVDGNYLNA
ncbi:hypothetical protein FEM48_Zijuj11G0133000 [Ziziphus jujuba var. spinosa]|uniref:Disease resistance protein RPM1-like n=1 Tax=Ziziphus jujuba var. spinosa TaxID=714518 RepID=A0A978UJ58_ZIZJJ|nr:hypothetical protein FEM48_Zijuj11G0133000 [Ziziphus jujuba var. spinosa]